MLKFYYYVYYLLFVLFWLSDVLSFLLVYKKRDSLEFKKLK